MPRKQGSPVAACLNLFKSNALGRLFTVSPRHTECFYLRLLLVNVTGPLSFQDIRKVNGQQYPTYKDACLALGLLEDDNQWECMLAEVALELYSNTNSSTIRYSVDYMFPMSTDIMGNSQRFND
ncbi:ATP-dependent DNA helicase [Trichonephila clavipes]|nr:ATP-dependent DNA helicase [Trichonephila clavipes]